MKLGPEGAWPWRFHEAFSSCSDDLWLVTCKSIFLFRTIIGIVGGLSEPVDKACARSRCSSNWPSSVLASVILFLVVVEALSDQYRLHQLRP